MKFEKMKIRLGNRSGQTFDLTYQIRNTKAAEIWAGCVKRSSEKRPADDNRFYNFPNQPQFELDSLVKKLDLNLSELKKLHPELDFPKLDKSKLQESINHLHFNFAHSHHVEKRMTDLNKYAWQEFNQLLHAIESALLNEFSLRHTGLNLSHIIFNWNDSEDLVAIPEESYKDFVINFEFGLVYAHYSQVGRHIHEMYRSKDDHLDNAHIQPYRFIGANTNLWFGPTTGHGFAHTQMQAIQEWFEQRKSRFNALGLYWGDPKLAIGRLPVARLENQLCSHTEVRDFVNHVSQFDQVLKVEIYKNEI